MRFLFFKCQAYFAHSNDGSRKLPASVLKWHTPIIVESQSAMQYSMVLPLSVCRHTSRQIWLLGPNPSLVCVYSSLFAVIDLSLVLLRQGS